MVSPTETTAWGVPAPWNPASTRGANYPPIGYALSPLDKRQKALPDCASIGYTPAMSGKDSGLRIRVEKALRDEFLEVCHAQDRPAAQVIREFMRDFVARNTNGNKKADGPSRP